MSSKPSMASGENTPGNAKAIKAAKSEPNATARRDGEAGSAIRSGKEVTGRWSEHRTYRGASRQRQGQARDAQQPARSGQTGQTREEQCARTLVRYKQRERTRSNQTRQQHTGRRSNQTDKLPLSWTNGAPGAVQGHVVKCKRRHQESQHQAKAKDRGRIEGERRDKRRLSCREEGIQLGERDRGERR